MPSEEKVLREYEKLKEERDKILNCMRAIQQQIQEHSFHAEILIYVKVLRRTNIPSDAVRNFQHRR